MTVLEDAKSTLERLDKVRAAAVGADEAKALELLRIALVELATPIGHLATSARIYRQEGVELSPIPDMKGVMAAVKTAQERFIENPKATTLRQGTRWTSLTSKLEAIAASVKATQESDWVKFFNTNYFGGSHPIHRFAKLAATPENKNAMKRYQEAYLPFAKYRSQPPVDSAAFNSLRLLSKELTEIIFQDDVPDDVKTFLDATSSGAELDLLTPGVLKWLRDNELLSNYIVRANVH